MGFRCQKFAGLTAGGNGNRTIAIEFATNSPLEGSGFELLVKEGSEAWVGEDGQDDVTQHRCRR